MPTSDDQTTAETGSIAYLKGWVGMQYLADSLRVSRQWVHKMIQDGDIPLDHVRQIRNVVEDDSSGRPTYVIRESYAKVLVRTRDAKQSGSPKLPKPETDTGQERKIRTWARRKGLTVPPVGEPLSKFLVRDYQDAQADRAKRVAPVKATKGRRNPQS